MDLFSNLPSVSTKEVKQVPAHRRTLLPNSGTDLFGDLPSPSNTNLTTTNEIKIITSSSSNNKIIEEKGIKRKLEEIIQKENLISEEIFSLRGFVSERKGEREEMQDAHFIFNDFKKKVDGLHSSITRLGLYGVFDGHAGSRASKYACKHIPNSIAAKFPKGDVNQVDKDMKKCFLETFKKTDEDFLKEAAKNKPSWKDGTTSITLLVINNTLYIANLGDSKAVLCRHNKESANCSVIPLSKDHSPTEYLERMRIQKSGGYVKDGRVLGVLEVSRSIGDGQFKTCGVICVPDIRRCQLQENDRFLVLACDGLWKVFTSEKVIQIINESLKDESISGINAAKSQELRCENACSKLVNEAVRKLSGDNVTVIIVLINKT